jgi:hypothetical protein
MKNYFWTLKQRSCPMGRGKEEVNTGIITMVLEQEDVNTFFLFRS